MIIQLTESILNGTLITLLIIMQINIAQNTAFFIFLMQYIL